MIEIKKYRKKPVTIEAVQFASLDDVEDCLQFCGGELQDGEIVIHTLEGDMKAHLRDWIIKGVQGEFYPCKPDIFRQTYEPYEPGW